MKLIKIETKGFKSFAEKISLSFDGGVVGIVGPNGSGKSNINDAIKWVLGERSIKNLRGSSSDDVIFVGSKTVPASQRAEVHLTFDNSDGAISLPHKQFTISRIVERGEGQNEYYINNEKANLKDINEIAMESGISKSSLAIISQGTIQNIAQANPEDRRAIFEEAAGISKYKSRKKEALRKLDATTEALEKVRTIIRELEKQLAPLKRQAEKAKIFLEKKKELRSVEITLIADDITFYTQKLEELNVELEDTLNTKEDLQNNVSFAENKLQEQMSFKLKLENEVHQLAEKYQNISDKLMNLEISNSQIAQRRQMIIDGQIASSASSRLEAIKEELNELSSKINQYNLWEKKINENIVVKREEVATKQSELSAINLLSEKAKRNLLQVKTKITILQDHEKNKSNLFKGTKSIIENKTLFPGFHDIVANIISVDTKFKIAVETVLSNSLQHLVVEDSSVAVKGVNFLKANQAGRATFIPLNVIKPKGVLPQHLDVIKNIDGFIGSANEIVSTISKYDILSRFLLGHILVARDIETAKEISDILDSRYMIVTLEGDVIRAGGVISGGEKNQSKNMLGVEEEITKLQHLIPDMERSIFENTNISSKLANEIGEMHSEISLFNIELAKIKEKSEITEKQYRVLKNQYESETDNKFESNNNQDDIESLEFFSSEKSVISSTLKSKRDSIAVLNGDISRLNIEKTEYEKSLRSLIENSSEKMTQKNQAEYIIKASKERLSQEYEMLYDAIKELTLDMDKDKAREIVASLRNDIKELGHINIDAIEEYNEVETRHTTLKDSEEELFNAQETILSAIGEMDKIIISRLDELVRTVNSEMNIIFQKMFGGGHSEVKYTNPHNLLETGIDVIAQPPGKTVKNLNLFSGGEKALVAISLLFAILKSKPLPLCILDEVEAALDDANVIRFAEYLQELKFQTQFIVITHRIGTMSKVDHLFGATMQQKGVTSFFTVKLEDAKKYITQEE